MKKMRLALLLLALAVIGEPCLAQDFGAKEWGANYSNCAGAKEPVRFKVGNDEGQNVVASAIMSCRDEGDAFAYTLDYMTLSLSRTSEWKSARLDWFGAAAQRAGSGGRSEWIYDEARPIRAEVRTNAKPVAVTNIAFRVPKRTLSQARGFSFYLVGGGIFWTLSFQGTPTQDEIEYAPKTAQPIAVKPPPLAAPNSQPLFDLKNDAAAEKSAKALLVGRSDWGSGFATCAGAKQPRLLKAASPDNDFIQASGVVFCTDADDAYVYTIDYMNFTLAPGSRWGSAHLEWFGVGVQRGDANGANNWVFDEAKPIQVEISGDRKRASVSNLSFRVPKDVLKDARGFGFYVVGGDILWSIFLL